jgi:glycine amidinotransferase
LDIGLEMMFDAANCMRLGTHIIFNSSTKNSDLGIKWLRDQLGEEYTVWPVELCDSHIDTSFVPLRPGLMMLDRPELLKRLPKPLQSWDVIYNPKSYDNLPAYEGNYVETASDAIDINLLMINPNLAIVQERNFSDLSKLLKPHNIECVPVRIRHDRLFAGGHHCTTLDIRRRGLLENYFD